MTSKPQVVHIKDLSLAAYLHCSGAVFIGLKPEGAHKLFIFEGEDLRPKMNRYWAGKAKVSALAYSQSLRTLKDRLFSGDR